MYIVRFFLQHKDQLFIESNYQKHLSMKKKQKHYHHHSSHHHHRREEDDELGSDFTLELHAKKRTEENLGSLFLECLQFYGKHFRYDCNGISG